MTEKEYEALYEALVAAHKVLPPEKDYDKTEADFVRRFANSKKPS